MEISMPNLYTMGTGRSHSLQMEGSSMNKKRSIPMPLVILCLGIGLIMGQIRCKWRKVRGKTTAAISSEKN